MDVSKWKYEGSVRQRFGVGRSAHYKEQWIWKCRVCGHTVRRHAGNRSMPREACLVCFFKEPAGKPEEG